MNNQIEGPAYVVTSNGFRDTLAYVDGWCYGKSRDIGTFVEEADIRRALHADIRTCMDERNGLPRYFVSDHGNIHRRRAVRLRNGRAR